MHLPDYTQSHVFAHAGGPAQNPIFIGNRRYISPELSFAGKKKNYGVPITFMKLCNVEQKSYATRGKIDFSFSESTEEV